MTRIPNNFNQTRSIDEINQETAETLLEASSLKNRIKHLLQMLLAWGATSLDGIKRNFPCFKRAEKTSCETNTDRAAQRSFQDLSAQGNEPTWGGTRELQKSVDLSNED